MKLFFLHGCAIITMFLGSGLLLLGAVLLAYRLPEILITSAGIFFL